jgi:HEAT repeat protein
MIKDETKLNKPFAEKPLDAWREQFGSSPDVEERYRALQAIAVLASAEQAIGWLTPGLSDAEASIRAGAARWLATQAGASPRAGGESEWQTIRGRWQTLLADDDPDVRFEAARGLILGKAEGRDSVRVLSDLLHDDQTQPVMLAAILNLFRQIPAGEVRPAWSRFLSHEQSAVREAAARALGSWGAGSAESASALLPLLDDEDPFVREEAAQSLGVIGVSSAEILAALASAANDEDDVVAAAARASRQRLQGGSE